jgi:transcriptional regulatory protein LevR
MKVFKKYFPRIEMSLDTKFISSITEMISICHKLNSQIQYEMNVEFSETELSMLEAVLIYATKDTIVEADVEYRKSRKHLVIKLSIG